MDLSQLLRALGLQQAYQSYQQNVGEPFAAVVGGGTRGMLGLDRPEYGGLLGQEAYRTGQAIGNMPAVSAPVGAFKAAAQAPELLSLLGTVATKTSAAKMLSKTPSDYSKFEDVVEFVNPKRIEPPHGVENKKKFDELVDSMKTEGWVGRPVLYYDIGRGPEALTGSHRIAAAQKAGLSDIPAVKVTGDIGDYVDEFGKSISELQTLDAKELSQWFRNYGDETAAQLMELEAMRQIN